LVRSLPQAEPLSAGKRLGMARLANQTTPTPLLTPFPAPCYASPLMRRIPAAFAAASFLVSAGCGYVGGPLTPLANVPAKVSDLAAVQRGAIVIVHFSVPALTTERRPIPKPAKFDLRIGATPEPFNPAQWLDHTKPLTEIHINQGLATVEVPIQEWIGKTAILGVRVIGANGKDAGWSNYEAVHVVPAPAVPTGFKADNTANGVHLGWSGTGDEFRIVRRGAATEPWAVVATVDSHEWTDTSTEFGKLYSFQIQSLQKLGDGKFAESDLSSSQDITPIDVFPPAIPTGLRADAAPSSIELVWDRNTEGDLAGYRIYRATGDGPFEKLAECNEIPNYSDHAVEHGKTYRYAITSFDKSTPPNESERSGTVIATFQ
jgi:hypothetical protein